MQETFSTGKEPHKLFTYISILAENDQARERKKECSPDFVSV